MSDVKSNSADNSIDTSCDSSIDLEHLMDSNNVTGLSNSSSEWESDWGKHITLYFLYYYFKYNIIKMIQLQKIQN